MDSSRTHWDLEISTSQLILKNRALDAAQRINTLIFEGAYIS